MPTRDLPNRADDLTPKERAFYDAMMDKIPDGETIVQRGVGGANTDLTFHAPPDFTEDEYWQVGHCLTILRWSWDALGNKGKPKWGTYLLHPL